MNILQKGVSCLTVMLLILSTAVLVHAEQAAIPVYVNVNESTLLTLREPSKRVSIANPKIAEINLVSPTQVLINGSKIGITSLIVWNKEARRLFLRLL
jgi:Flp pilus assembly secretin CpaC